MAHHLKRALRILLRTLLVLVTLALLYVLVALVLSRIGVPAEEWGGNDVTAYIHSNGVHTDIVVPVRSADKDWTHSVPYAHTKDKDSTANWLAFGWGDKGFYLETPTWDDLTARVAFRAMFALGGSAMHTTFHKEMEEGPQCKQITLSHAQYLRLIAFIEQSFAMDAQGNTQLIPTTASYGTTDAFYEGTGNYHFFHTCNTWTNDALKACGQRACVWTPTAGGILRQYE